MSTPNVTELYSDGARAIVFFDGVCGLCEQAVQFCRAHDSQRKLRFAPIQGKTYQRLLGEMRLDSVVVATLGKSGIKRIHRYSDAALEVASHLDFPWSALGVLKILPRFLRDIAYRLMAAIRYRVFGKYTACRVPSPEERVLFFE